MKSCQTKKEKITAKKKTVRKVKTTKIHEEEKMPVERQRFLYLMRHGKASKDYEAYTDKERPLIKRGKKDAEMMKKFMKKMRIQPAICLVSPSVRTRETLEIVNKAFNNAKIVFDEVVYAETEDVTLLLEKIRSFPEECEEILVVGHLPTLPNLAKYLANEGVSDEDGLKRMGKKFPTSSMAVLELNPAVSWNDLDVGTCRLTAFVRPKDLKG